MNERGSVFVQINEQQQHLVRIMLDEIFGRENHISLITFRKKMMPLGAEGLESVSDYILWYAKDKKIAKKYNLYRAKQLSGDPQWSWVELPDGSRRRLTKDERSDVSKLPKNSRIFQPISMLPADYRQNQDFYF